jgi:hypothetical protein
MADLLESEVSLMVFRCIGLTLRTGVSRRPLNQKSADGSSISKYSRGKSDLNSSLQLKLGVSLRHL